MLTMVVLLFGIVSTHGLSTKSAEGHLVTSDVSPVAVLHNEPALSAASSTALRLSAVQQV
ncbi:hypothetical protein [Streptomyces sp. NPDC096132]|uniref:hypothetical protein n=1 Tax=Streptomyces sp. NPDC096132 TaxID=3366075 RepID=UPI00380DF710